MESFKKVVFVLLIFSVFCTIIFFVIRNNKEITTSKDPQNVVSSFKKLHILKSDSDEVTYDVSIADDSYSRMLGLMFVKDLPKNKGMFFVFEQEVTDGFWMKNCEIPLDIIFVDKDFNIVSITEDAPPCLEKNCPVYTSDTKYKYVLELNGGIIKLDGVRKGMKIAIEL